MGSPEALFANVSHQLLLSVVLAGKAWKDASCVENKEKGGLSKAFPFSPACYHLTPDTALLKATATECCSLKL